MGACRRSGCYKARVTPDLSGLAWTRSTSCSAGTCVEVAAVGDTVLLRDSKRLDKLPLKFTRAEFSAFTDGIVNGDFDDL